MSQKSVWLDLKKTRTSTNSSKSTKNRNGTAVTTILPFITDLPNKSQPNQLIWIWNGLIVCFSASYLPTHFVAPKYFLCMCEIYSNVLLTFVASPSIAWNIRAVLWFVVHLIHCGTASVLHRTCRLSMFTRILCVCKTATATTTPHRYTIWSVGVLSLPAAAAYACVVHVLMLYTDSVWLSPIASSDTLWVCVYFLLILRTPKYTHTHKHT